MEVLLVEIALVRNRNEVLLRKWNVLRLFAGDLGLVLSDVLYVISDCCKMNIGHWVRSHVINAYR